MRTDNFPEWVDIDEYAEGININKYFISHPEMILGDMELKNSRFDLKLHVKCVTVQICKKNCIMQ